MCKLMPKGLENTVMFKGDEDSFESFFRQKVVSFASVKHSLSLDDKPVPHWYKERKRPNCH